MSDYGYKKNEPRNPDRIRFSPQEIIDAFLQGDFGKVFRGVESKINSPFINLPKNAESIDIRRVSDATAGTFEELFLSYQPPKGFEAIITGYGIFSDAQFAISTEFIPKVNGSRVFPYHGQPRDVTNPRILPYKICLGLGPDLTDVSLVECSLRLKETDLLTWQLTNASIVSQTMGVRFKGYLRSINEARDYKVGG
jgi:hypothetical protein